MPNIFQRRTQGIDEIVDKAAGYQPPKKTVEEKPKKKQKKRRRR